jgi:hypothetical protein
MENYLKYIRINSLLKWIKSYIHGYKLKRMNTILSRTFDTLSKNIANIDTEPVPNSPRITDVKIENGRLMFSYKDCPFYISSHHNFSKPNEAYLKVTHITRRGEYDKDNNLTFVEKDVDDFDVQILNMSGIAYYHITKYSLSNPSFPKTAKMMGQGTMTNTTEEDLASDFVKEFIARLKAGFEVDVNVKST